MQPTGFKKTERGLRIKWSDGQTRDYSAVELRKACPCATCKEKHGAPPPSPGMLPVLSAAEARPLTIQGMQPVGAYAYSVQFSDGHSSGLYQFALLRELGQPVD